MIEKIDIHVVDHCNLNCTSCTHFSPLAEPFYLDIEKFEKDLTRFSSLINAELKQLFLLGGEPLLHPELEKFFPIARKLLPKTTLVVITNGTLLNKKDNDFWKISAENKIQYWVSDYNYLNIDKDKIQKKAKEFKVFLGYTSTQKDKQNRKIWGKYKLDLEGKQYFLNAHAKCAIKNCATLKDGKLYPCCTTAHIEHFNKFFNQNLNVSEFDYANIYKVNSTKELISILNKPIPFCRFCKTSEYENGFWMPSKKDIKEWT